MAFLLKQLALLALLVLSVQYCYSDSISPYYSRTGNAAFGTHAWNMDSILPPNVPGLDITSIIYSYEIQKNTDDNVKVHVQNSKKNGEGYIFRSTDDWQPGSLTGTSINKIVPVQQSNRLLWGDGSIEVSGNGMINDPRVMYNYRIDPCYDPQFDPNCPGYTIPSIPNVVEVDIDALYETIEDGNIALDTCTQGDTSPRCTTILSEQLNESVTEEETDEKEQRMKEKTKERLEKALAASDNSALFADSFSQAKILQQSNNKMNMNSYYVKYINGGEYDESTHLDGGDIRDNPKGRRLNFSSQKRHKEIIEMQYNNNIN